MICASPLTRGIYKKPYNIPRLINSWYYAKKIVINLETWQNLSSDSHYWHISKNPSKFDFGKLAVACLNVRLFLLCFFQNNEKNLVPLPMIFITKTHCRQNEVFHQGFLHIYWRKPSFKASFFVQWHTNEETSKNQNGWIFIGLSFILNVSKKVSNTHDSLFFSQITITFEHVISM